MSDNWTSIVEYDPKRAASDVKYTPLSTRSPCFIAYESAFRGALGDEPSLRLVAKREDKFAHEAGVFIKATNKVYFTSNYQTGKAIEIYSVDCGTDEVEELKVPAAVNANGACNYQDKVLFCCQGDLTTPSALVLFDPVASTSEVLLNNFHGREFNSVNDVVVHHETGDIWFTDPCYGYHQAFRISPQLPSQIYRFRPSTGQIWCVADGFVECNGLCFSPDYKKMYVTDTGAVQAHGTPYNGMNFSLNPRLPASTYSFDVVHGERLANRQMLAYCDSGVPDGIKCDVEGYVYSGCGDGIHVWDPNGTLVGKIYVGSTIANFNFTKEGIWAFAEEKLFFIRINRQGALIQIEC